MAINRTPILKRCRSLELEPAFLGVNKKSNRKPIHNARKVSEYALQLREKQKAKFVYGVQEKPFRNLYEKASRMQGLVGPNLMTLLELRLDNIIFRMGFARTRREARQVVSHRHVLVNGKIVNIPSYKVEVGDTIEIKEKSKSLQRFKDIVEVTGGYAVPAWMESSTETLSGKILEKPLREQIDTPVNETLIVELYSK